MASGAAPVGGLDLLADADSEVEWLPQVAAASLVYHLLELEWPGIAVPVVAISVEYCVLTLVLPAEIVPWLPPRVVPLGELDTSLPAADGQQVAVALVRVGARAAGLLVPYSGRVPWCVEQQWPSADGLRTLAAAAEGTFAVTPEDLERNWAVVLAWRRTLWVRPTWTTSRAERIRAVRGELSWTSRGRLVSRMARRQAGRTWSRSRPPTWTTTTTPRTWTTTTTSSLGP